MINHNRWRDQQLSGFSSIFKQPVLLEQESRMLEFVRSCPGVQWLWQAPDTQFKQTVQEHASLGPGTGIIVFGPVLDNLTTGQLIQQVGQLVANYSHAYVAVNRYEVTRHDWLFELPDSIEHSLDQVMTRADARFRRLYTYDHVDGEHMVAAHPMDCYVICK